MHSADCTDVLWMLHARPNLNKSTYRFTPCICNACVRIDLRALKSLPIRRLVKVLFMIIYTRAFHNLIFWIVPIKHMLQIGAYLTYLFISASLDFHNFSRSSLLTRSLHWGTFLTILKFDWWLSLESRVAFMQNNKNYQIRLLTLKNGNLSQQCQYITWLFLIACR